MRHFREDSGNGGMIARELPPDEVLASWQHVEQRALALRAAGMPGTLQELRVKAYLDLLQERDSRVSPGDSGAAGTGGADGTAAADGRGGTGGTSGPGGGGGTGGTSGPGGGGGTGGTSGPGGGGPGPSPQGSPAWSGPDGQVRQPEPGSRHPGPSVAALVNITVPLATVQGLSGTPADVGGFGLLDARDARDLVAAAARHPGTRWCVTALHPDGTAAAHGCARGRHPPPGTAARGDPPGPDPPPGVGPQDYLRSLQIQMVPIARGRCDHTQAETGYQPSRALQHLIRVRSARCTALGCGRPAARCDLDHTQAWHQGGLTCECDLAPLCRHHHRCKQAQGWQLEQPEPGVLKWRTPAGRTYATSPTVYPM